MSTCFADIAATLLLHPAGLTARQLAEVMHIGPLTASHRLSRMFAYGHAERLKTPGRPRTNRSFTYVIKQRDPHV